jgi:hypothetical protein
VPAMLDANEAPAATAARWRPESRRGTDGFFRVGQTTAGAWSMLDPEGRPFFCQAVHGVRMPRERAEEPVVQDSVARLRRWGFNVLGAEAEPGAKDDGLPFLGVANFLSAGPVVVAPGVRLPDVFDPDWPKRAAAHALAVCPPLAEERPLVGWLTDDEIAWAQPSLAGRPSLLQLCLSLEPSAPAYHAAWEFVLALHHGRLETLARAWSVTLPNKETVRELTRAEEGIGTRGYLRDDARWTREFARRYFTTCAAAIRAADANHLILGCRSDAPIGAAVMAECRYPAVDVMMCDWRELPVGGGEEAAMPILASNVAVAAPEFLKLPTAARVLRLTSVEWMYRRARNALDRLARHPAVVGYAWGRWQDEPGEQPPFARGLVHVGGAEAREHTELIAQFNARVETLRSLAG